MRMHGVGDADVSADQRMARIVCGVGMTQMCCHDPLNQQVMEEI